MGEGNVLKGLKFFSVSMPLFLNTVFRESSDLDSMWTVAMQMRDTAEAVAFRAWVKTVQLADEPKKVAALSTEARKLSDDLIRAFDTGKADIRMGVGFPNSRSISSKPDSGQMKREKIHIRFLRRFVGSAMKDAQVGTEVTRLFHVPKEVADESVALLAKGD